MVSLVGVRNLIWDLGWYWRNRVLPTATVPFWFLKNVWRFRRELFHFRDFDYAYNLRIFARSLEITAEFLESGDAMSASAKRDARDIRKFLRYLRTHEEPMREAERLSGKDFAELYLDPDTQRPEFRELMELAEKVEVRSWKNSWKLIARRGRGWWD